MNSHENKSEQGIAPYVAQGVRCPVNADVGVLDMKTIFTVFLMMVTAAIAANTNSLSFEAASEQAFRTANEADHVISFTIDGKFDIGLGQVKNNTRTPIYLDYPQVEKYFSFLKHRDLIVIIFDKNMWDEQTLKQHIQSLNDFFFKCGFKRVVIQQGYAFGRGTWSDKINPQQSGAGYPPQGVGSPDP